MYSYMAIIKVGIGEGVAGGFAQRRDIERMLRIQVQHTEEKHRDRGGKNNGTGARTRRRGKSGKGDGNKERESEIADLVDTVYTPWSGQRSNGGARGEDGESGEDAGRARAGQVACAPAPYKGRGAGTRAREPADPPAIYAGAPRLFDASSTTEIRTVPETYTRAHTRRQRRAPAQRPRPPEDPPVLGPRTCVRGRSGATARGGGGERVCG